MWQVRTQSANGDPVAYLSTLTNRRASFYLNRPPVFSGSINADSGTAADLGLRPGQDEALVIRDGAPQESVFVLTTAEPFADADETRVELSWEGIGSYLADALVYGRRSAYSGTTLPWTWINAYQSRTSGDRGITQGTQTGTPASRSRLLESDGTLLDEIIGLSESGDGFDWAINPAREYVEWHTERGADNGLTLTHGVNVTAYSYTRSAAPGEIVSDLRVQGPPGSGAPGTASDATSRSTYGRREASVGYLSELENVTVSTSQLAAYATKQIADRAAPLIVPQLTIDTTHPSVAWGSYWLGDTVRFVADVGVYDRIDAQHRIVAIHADIDENDNEQVTIELNAVPA